MALLPPGPFNPPGVVPRPSPQNPLMGPVAQPAQTPAALAAFAKRYNLGPIPGITHPPAQPTTFAGAPGSVAVPKPGPFPGFMTPQQMFDQAKQMADLSFGPVLKAAYDQQRRLHDQNMAQLQAIQAAYQAIGIDPKSAIGVASYNKALAEAQASESDFAGKLVDLVAQQGQAQAGYLSDLQKQQAGLYSDYQSQHKLSYHFGANGEIIAMDPTGNIKVVRPGTVPTTADKPPKTFGSAATGIFAWQQTKDGWQAVPIPGTKAVKPGAKPAAAKPPQTITLPNGNLAVWQPAPNGKGWRLITISRKGNDPTKPTINGPGGVPMTPTQINAAAATVTTSIASAKRKGIPLQKVLDTFEQHGIPSEIYTPLVMKAYGIPSTITNVGSMSIQQLYRVAVLYGYRPPLTAGKGGYVATDVLGNKHALTVAQVQAINDKGMTEALKDTKLFPPIFQGATIEQVRGPGRPAGGFGRQQLISFIRQHLPKAETAAETAATGFGSRLVNFAKQQLGQTYVWGGESRKEGGFDCSGLVDWAMRQEGYNGPRVTTWTLRNMGQHVVLKNIQPGDLIITNNGKHVVIYAGNNQVVAGSSAQGKVVMQPLSGITINEIRRVGGQAPVTRPISTSRMRPDKIDTFLSHHASPLAGLGGVFVKAGAMYGVDPALLVAIAGAESSFGRTIRGSHNPFGWGPGINFTSWPAAIYAVAKGLRNLYIKKGLTTIEAIGRKWAPVGARNDPTNLNSNWTGNVSRYYRELTESPI